jgi:hypothetical protein
VLLKSWASCKRPTIERPVEAVSYVFNMTTKTYYRVVVTSGSGFVYYKYDYKNLLYPAVGLYYHIYPVEAVLHTINMIIKTQHRDHPVVTIYYEIYNI